MKGGGTWGGNNIHRESHCIAHLKTSLIANVVLQGCVSARISITPPGAGLFTLLQQEYTPQFALSCPHCHDMEGIDGGNMFSCMTLVTQYLYPLIFSLQKCNNEKVSTALPSTSTGMWRSKVLDNQEAAAIW